MSIPFYTAIPIFVGLSTQLIKFTIALATKKNISWRNFNDYGGFPSSHTAFTISLATVAYLVQGIDSLAFAICAVIAIITIRDALGIRGYLSLHSTVLNKMAENFQFADKKFRFVHLEEQIGHHLNEIIGGGIIGIFLTILYYKIFLG